MNVVDPAALGARAQSMIDALGAISAEPDRLVRLFLTPEHRRAAELVASWMRAAGMTVSEDALGTVRGRYGDGSRRLLIGSHLAAHFEWTMRHPVEDRDVTVRSLLSREGSQWIWLNMVGTFTSFHPLGVVLVAMLGIGVAVVLIVMGVIG